MLKIALKLHYNAYEVLLRAAIFLLQSKIGITKHRGISLLSANPTKWSSKRKQFVGLLPTNRLSVLHYFVGLAIKVLKPCQTSVVKYSQLLLAVHYFWKTIHLRYLTKTVKVFPASGAAITMKCHLTTHVPLDVSWKFDRRK